MFLGPRHRHPGGSKGTHLLPEGAGQKKREHYLSFYMTIVTHCAVETQ